METLLDINPFLLIVIVFGVLVLLVIIVANLPIKIKQGEMPPRRRSSSSGQSWFSMPYPEDEAWRRYPGFSSDAREKRKRWIEKEERKMFGC